MNILRIIASVDPKHGGTSEAVRLSAQSMKRLGHGVEVVTLDKPDAPFLTTSDLHVHALGSWMKRYGYTPSMARWIKDNGARYDAAIIDGLWNHASIGGWQGLGSTRLPYAIFTHGMLDPWFKEAYPLKNVAKQVFWTVWQGKVLRDAYATLFTTEEECLLARGAFRGHSYREKVVGLGIEEPPPRSQAQAEAFARAVPNLGGRPFILFLARIHEKKGCDLLVSAFAKLAHSDRSTNLVIAGPDQQSLQERLQQQCAAAGIADRVHWPGFIAGDAKWGAIYGADAFILPSHSENFGIAVAEAMACGTAVLTTDKVNIWREIAAAGAGFVAQDTLDGTVSLLRQWFALDEASKKDISARARQAFETYFQVDQANLRLLDVLASAVREKR